MFPTSIQPNIKPSSKLLNFPSQNPRISTHPCSISGIKFRQCTKKVNLKQSASSPAVDPILADEQRFDGSAAETSPHKEKLGVVVKPLEKPRIVLKFIWMKKNIGIALDQVIPGYGTIPLSPYYFWPRKDAWEELKILLEGKRWISQGMRVQLLNQATDIINLWQASGGNLS
ncbi:hypothetical protein SLA2020_085740 [Shorea laevis]